MKPVKGWRWIVASGVITALAGFVIALGWPVNSLWILGLFWRPILSSRARR